jgi:hypothetical protein
MRCQRCGHADAAWVDDYRDEAVCPGCCPDRADAYGMAFVRPLIRADITRLSKQDRNGGRGGGAR